MRNFNSRIDTGMESNRNRANRQRKNNEQRGDELGYHTFMVVCHALRA
jgi:hypothetical protein